VRFGERVSQGKVLELLKAFECEVPEVVVSSGKSLWNCLYLDIRGMEKKIYSAAVETLKRHKRRREVVRMLMGLLYSMMLVYPKVAVTREGLKLMGKTMRLHGNDTKIVHKYAEIESDVKILRRKCAMLR
jgi:hypothetical protein